MRTVIQRVSHASVTIEGNCKSAIGKGMLILVGIEEADGQEDIDWLCKKIVNLRIFDDENGVMNKSILEDGGEILRHLLHLFGGQCIRIQRYRTGIAAALRRAEHHGLIGPHE